MTYDKYLRLIINQPGLVGCWMFNSLGSPNLHDHSGKGNHGTINGATWRGNRGAGALDFDGTDDYVEANGVSSGGFFGDAHTICAWGKLSSWAGGCTIAGANLLQNAPFYSEIDFNTNGYFYARASEGHGSSNEVESLNSYNNDSEWHHFALVVNASGQIVAFYIDGVNQGSDSTYSNDISSPDKFYIGQLPWGSANVNPWDGLIDEVRIYNRKVRIDEIRRNYELGKQFHID